MYERLTDRARKVMQLANQEAQSFGQEFIGAEHILIGLLKEGRGVAANVLKNLGMDLGAMRLEVEKIVQSGPEKVIMGKLPQTPCAKKVIEHAMEESRNLNHNYVGTEHLLLGLLREQELSVALRVFQNLGVKLDDVREEVMNLLGRAVEDKGEEEKLNEVIAKHYSWLCKIEMPGILVTPLDGLIKAFMKQTGLPADRVELCSRIEGDTTHYWFQERASAPQPVPAPAPTPIAVPETAGCKCKSLIHGHEQDCPMS